MVVRLIGAVLLGALMLSVGVGVVEDRDDNSILYTLYSDGRIENHKVVRDTTVFVGDSRVVGMETASDLVGKGAISYLGKVGAGYSWLSSECINTIQDYENVNIVLCFGVNDLGNIENYVTLYRTLMDTNQNVDWWVLSVNPVDEGKESQYGYSVRNFSIEDFNARLQEEFSDIYIDSYSYLLDSGYATVDGVHYTPETYRNIENFVIGKLQGKG